MFVSVVMVVVVAVIIAIIFIFLLLLRKLLAKPRKDVSDTNVHTCFPPFSYLLMQASLPHPLAYLTRNSAISGSCSNESGRIHIHTHVPPTPMWAAAHV